MLNRKDAPKLGHVAHIPIRQPEVTHFANGQELSLLPIGDQEVVRFDILYSAGRWQQEVPLSANFVAGLMKEGTQDYSSKEISEILDGTGGYLQISAGMHHTTLSLFSLNKHIPTLLPLMESVLSRPVFSEKEVETYRKNKLQKFIHESQKVNVIAAQHFKSHIFGGKHPYGYVNEANDYTHIKREDVQHFYSNHLLKAPAQMLLTGNITNEVLKRIESAFGSATPSSITLNQNEVAFQPSKDKVFHFTKPGAVQTAIQMGVATISKSHPDFCPFLVLNTILGGYFGSRLMRNIREEKGYTYGIASALVPYLHCGILTIYTQTDNAYKDLVIKEIHKEIDKLIHTQVQPFELEMVKNYLRGDLIRNTDHPFQLAESLHALMEFDLNVGFIDQYLHTINTITSDQLQQIAQKYLSADFYIITAGGDNK